MQGDERFHPGLLPVDADEPPTLRRRPDMARMELLDVGIGKPGEISGRGIASALVKAAYDYALANGLVPVATCSYAVVWLERHPEYNGKTGKDYAGEGTCAL